jgi:hypothetical protein
VALRPNAGHGLIHEVSRSQTTTHTVGRTPSGCVISSSQRLLTTHNTHSRQTFMSTLEFEPTFSAGERPQTYALDRAATGTGNISGYSVCLQQKLQFVQRSYLYILKKIPLYFCVQIESIFPEFIILKCGMDLFHPLYL